MKNSVFVDKRQDEGSCIDVILFDIISAVAIIFTLSNITMEGGIALDNANAQNAFMAIPALIVFTLLSLLFIARNHDRPGKGNTKLFLILFLIFAVFKIIFMCTYPYGEVTYTFTDPGNSKELTLVYKGLSVYNRVVDSLCDIGICAYFMILFSYMNTLGQKGHKNTFFLLLVIIAVAIVLNIISYFTDGDLYLMNISYYLGLDDSSTVSSITGMLYSKNQLAFFNNLALFAVIIIFCKKPNPFSVILAVYFMITTILVMSRIASVISIVACIAVLVVFPIFNIKRHKGYSVFCIVFDVAFVTTILILYFGVKNERVVHFFDTFLERFFKTNNLTDRFERMEVAFSMLFDNAYSFIFGYGSNASAAIMKEFFSLTFYGLADQTTFNAHNGILQTWLDFGFFGLVLSLVGVVYLFYMSIRIARTQGNGCLGIMYVVILLMCLLHSSLEPRFMFLDEGSPIVFIVTVIFPIYNDYYRYVSSPHAKIDRRKQKLVLKLA